MTKYERGKAIRISVEIKDRNGTYIDPTTPVIKIANNNGKLVVSSTTLTKTETGKYYYIWDTTETMALGNYFITTNGTYSGHSIFERTKIELVVLQ